MSEHGSGADPGGDDDTFDPQRTVGSGAFDPERTVGGDDDLLAEVRSAVEAARRGLAAPPSADEHRARRPAGQPRTGTAPGSTATAFEPPMTAAGAPTMPSMFSPPISDVAGGSPLASAPLPPPGASPANSSTAQRWVPPPRLRPAATPAPTAFLDTPPPRRNRTPWWIAGGVAVAALVGTGIALVVRDGGSSPTDDTTVSVPDSTPATSAASTTTGAPTTTRAPTTTAAATTTRAPTTTVAPVTEAPTTVAPPPPETQPVPPDTTPAATP